MKKLLNTLFVTTPDVYLSLDGENVVVKKGSESIGRYALHNLEAICTFGYAGVSPTFMGACVDRDIALTFMTKNGRYLARVIGETRGNVILRKEQYRISDDEKRSAIVSRNFILGKIFNSKWILERATRDYPLRLDVDNSSFAPLGSQFRLDGTGQTGEKMLNSLFYFRQVFRSGTISGLG